jgi:hypothetical protein
MFAWIVKSPRRQNGQIRGAGGGLTMHARHSVRAVRWQQVVWLIQGKYW